MLNQREAAEMERDREELEKRREALKLQVQMHRDKGEEAPIEELEAMTKEATEINAQIEAINEELRTVTKPNPEIGGQIPTMVNEISRENFRGTKQYRDAFYRSLINRSIAEADRELMAWSHERAITDMNGLSVSSGAAYLVPETTLNEISAIINKVSPLSGLVTRYNFNGAVTIPIGTPDTTTNNSDGTDTLAFIFTELAIGQDAVVALVEMKNLLLKNGISGIEQFIAAQIGEYIGLQLENYILNGNSTNWVGIKTAHGSATETGVVLDWEKIAAWVGSVPSPYGDEGVWLMSRANFYNKFYGLTDANGQPLCNVIPGLEGGQRNYILGRPVVFTSKLGSSDVIYGDLKQFVMNVSQELVIEADASAGFAADKTIWRGKLYAGGKTRFATTAFNYKTIA